jgi:hypothetical protein
MITAVVSAITALLVVILTNGLGRLLETRRRYDKALDYVVALHAEIAAGLQTAEQQTTEEEQDYSRRDTTPFAIADETDFVFESIKSDLTLLPMEVIHEVVVYYKLSQRSILLTKALSSDALRKQDAAAVRKYVDGLLKLLEEQEHAALIALEALESYSARHNRDLTTKRGRAGRRQVQSHNRDDRAAHG